MHKITMKNACERWFCLLSIVLILAHKHTNTHAHTHRDTHTQCVTHREREGGREREGILSKFERIHEKCLRLLALRYHAAAFFWTCAQLMTRVLIMM